MTIEGYLKSFLPFIAAWFKRLFFCPCFQSDPGGCSRDKGVDGCRNIRKEGAAGLAAAIQPATACQRYKFSAEKSACLPGWRMEGKMSRNHRSGSSVLIQKVATRIHCRTLRCCGRCCRQYRSSNSRIWRTYSRRPLRIFSGTLCHRHYRRDSSGQGDRCPCCRQQ